MASITREANGRRTIQFVGSDGKRRSIRLGKVSQRLAESVQVRVEHLAAAQVTGGALDGETARWVADLDTRLADKLAAVGLVPKRLSATVGAFLDQFAAGRIDVKASTQEVWSQPVRNLKGFFGVDRPLRSITAGDAEDFRLYLVAQQLAPTTIHKRLQFARQFFRAACRHKLIAENPFAEVRSKAAMDSDRRRFITPEETGKLLEACPSIDWRVIVALSRYGGLRCPSEVLSLRWQDLDWERGRLTVTSPKTEHHPGKDTRTIPLFPELRPMLGEAFDVAPEGAVYVVNERYRRSSMGPHGWRGCNLRTTFEKIIRRAGLIPWPRLFHNLRSSRETELTKRFPIQVVTAWLGNTPDIALRHYLQVTEDHFRQAAEAVQNPVQQPAERVCTGSQAPVWLRASENGSEEPNVSPCEGLRPLAGPCGAVVSSCGISTSGEGGIRTLGPG